MPWWRVLVHEGAGLREECGEKYRGGAIEGEPYWSEVEGAGSTDSSRLYISSLSFGGGAAVQIENVWSSDIVITRVLWTAMNAAEGA
jgi:hypothetical protein